MVLNLPLVEVQPVAMSVAGWPQATLDSPSSLLPHPTPITAAASNDKIDKSS